MWVANGVPYADSDKSKFTSYFVVPLQTCKAVHVMEVLTQIAFSYCSLSVPLWRFQTNIGQNIKIELDWFGILKAQIWNAPFSATTICWSTNLGPRGLEENPNLYRISSF